MKLASFRAAVAELRALVARQAAAILRLPNNHLANPGGGAAPAAIAAGSAPAPAALARPAPPAAAEPQPSPPMRGIAALRRRARHRPLIPRQSWLPRRGRPRTAAAAVDQLVPLLRKALKLSKPYSKPTIGGGLHRVTVYRRRQKCGPMTDIWMENCGIITNELDPARIVAAAVDPKVIKAAALPRPAALVVPTRINFGEFSASDLNRAVNAKSAKDG